MQSGLRDLSTGGENITYFKPGDTCTEEDSGIKNEKYRTNLSNFFFWKSNQDVLSLLV